MISTEAEAQRLICSGYRPTSNRYRMLARIDRKDWREHMASTHPNGMKWVEALGEGAGDHYRSVHSKDRIEIDAAVFQQVKRQLKHAGAGYGWGNCNQFHPIRESAPRALHI